MSKMKGRLIDESKKYQQRAEESVGFRLSLEYAPTTLIGLMGEPLFNLKQWARELGLVTKIGPERFGTMGRAELAEELVPALRKFFLGEDREIHGHTRRGTQREHHTLAESVGEPSSDGTEESGSPLLQTESLSGGETNHSRDLHEARDGVGDALDVPPRDEGRGSDH